MPNRARIVELAVAASLAAASGAAAFLGMPLDPAGRPGGWMPAGPPAPEPSAAPKHEGPTPEQALRAAVRERSPRPGDDPFQTLVPPPRPYRYFAPEDLRLHPTARCDGERPSSRACRTRDRFYAAIARRTTLLDDPDDEMARDVLFLLGRDHQALGDYEKAAEYYEAFARHDPSADGQGCTDEEKAEGTCANAPAALENAMLFRRALGQTDRALDDAELYVTTYGETRVTDAARVALEAGRILEREGAAREAASHYAQVTRSHARHLPPGQALRMRVRLGRARLEAGDERAGRRVLRAVVRRWQSGLAERVAAAPDSAGEASGEEFSRTLEAVGEAAFLLAERRRDAFRAIAPPTYEGDGSTDDVERWVELRLRPWVVRKARALREARDAYDSVALLGVTRWQLAAQARTGQMLRAMMEQLSAIPTVRIVPDGDELTAGVVVVRPDWQEPAVARLREPAIAAFEKCLETAVRTRHHDEWSRLCATELTRLAPRSHPGVREIVPTQLHVHDAFVDLTERGG